MVLMTLPVNPVPTGYTPSVLGLNDRICRHSMCACSAIKPPRDRTDFGQAIRVGALPRLWHTSHIGSGRRAVSKTISRRYDFPLSCPSITLVFCISWDGMSPATSLLPYFPTFLLSYFLIF